MESISILITILQTYLMIVLGILILVIVGQWKVFTKAGEAGWKSIIPIYNTITLFKIAGLSPWLVLVYLLGAIPVLGAIIVLVLTIYLNNSLAKAFGKGFGFTLGLIFFPMIFMPILGFGSAEYNLEK